MKRFWQNWLAVIATLAMIGPAAAQNDMNQLSEIGSYQSILSRAGYRDGGGNFGAGGPVSSPYRSSGYSGQPMNGGPMVNRSMPFNGFSQEAAAAAQADGAAHGGAMVDQGSVMMNQGAGVVSGGCTSGCNSGGQVVGGYSDGAMMGGGYGGDAMYGGNAMYGGGSMYGGGNAMYGGGGGLVGVPCGQNDGYIDQGYAYNAAPVYSPGARLGGRLGGRRGAGGSNRVIGLRGLFFDRDYENHRTLSRNPSGDTLYTTDADHGTFGGFQFDMVSRGQNGRGWGFTYWGLYPGEATATLTGSPVYTTIRGFDQLSHGGFNVYDIYGQGDTHTLTRNTTINNIEFNMLSNGGCFTTRSGGRASYEMMAGLRWFQFDESLNYQSLSTFGGYPAELNYNSDVENDLFGLQVGGKTEYCLTNRLRFGVGTKVGLFNNNINVRQQFVDGAGGYSTLNGGTYAGDDYNFSDEKNDIAFLGELDLNLYYHLSGRTRAVFGYRAVGVSGLALAADQIPDDFTDVDKNFRTNSNSALLLHGGHAGLEFCY